MFSFRGAEMRQANLIVFDHLPQAFTRQTWKLAELSEQPPETIERSAQQPRPFGEAEFGKSNLQIAQARPSQTRRQQVSEPPERSSQSNRQRARQRTVERSEERRVGKECRSRWSP